MGNDDMIMEPQFKERLLLLHDVDKERDVVAIPRWESRLTRDRREIRRTRASNVYIPLHVNNNHWILVYISTIHDTITVYDSNNKKPGSQKAQLKILIGLIQAWWHHSSPNFSSLKTLLEGGPLFQTSE
jgi:hypothetical protein